MKPAEEMSSFVIPLTLDWQVPQDGPKTVVWEGDLPGGGQRQMTKGSNSPEKHCYLNRHSSSGWRLGEAVYRSRCHKGWKCQRGHTSHTKTTTSH